MGPKQINRQLNQEAQIAKRLKEGRLHLELTQKTLAKRAGLSRSAVVHYEQGNAVPGGLELAKLAQALGRSPNYLLSGSEDFFVSNAPDHLLSDDSPEKILPRLTVYFMVLDREVREAISALITRMVRAKLTKKQFADLAKVLDQVPGALAKQMPSINRMAERASGDIVAPPKKQSS